MFLPGMRHGKGTGGGQQTARPIRHSNAEQGLRLPRIRTSRHRSHNLLIFMPRWRVNGSHRQRFLHQRSSCYSVARLPLMRHKDCYNPCLENRPYVHFVYLIENLLCFFFRLKGFLNKYGSLWYNNEATGAKRGWPSCRLPQGKAAGVMV